MWVGLMVVGRGGIAYFDEEEGIIICWIIRNKGEAEESKKGDEILWRQLVKDIKFVCIGTSNGRFYVGSLESNSMEGGTIE